MKQCNKTLPPDSVVEYFNLATNETVKLKVVINNDKFCKGCYFRNTQRHCPEQWACGKYARIDGKTIIFKLVGRAV